MQECHWQSGKQIRSRSLTISMDTSRNTRHDGESGGFQFFDGLIKVVGSANNIKTKDQTRQRFSTFERFQTKRDYGIMKWIAMTPTGTIPPK